MMMIALIAFSLIAVFGVMPAWIATQTVKGADFESIFSLVMCTLFALIPVSLYQSFFGG